MLKFTGFDEAVVINVKSTGFSPARDRIVSVSLIRWDFSKLRSNPTVSTCEAYDLSVNPMRRIHRKATRLHGITNDDVANEPAFELEALDVRNFIGNLPIIAHNAKLDLRFLNAEFERVNVETLHLNQIFCTMRRFREQFSGMGNVALEVVAGLLGIEGRKSGKLATAEDARIAFEIARAFFVLDNNIPVSNE